MWPFRKKELPPPPEPVPLSVNSAAVRWILSYLDQYPEAISYLIEERPPVVVFEIESVGTASAEVSFDGEYSVLEFQDWLDYDPHYKKRRANPATPVRLPDGVKIEIRPSPMERELHSLGFPDELGNIYAFHPTSLVQ